MNILHSIRKEGFIVEEGLFHLLVQSYLQLYEFSFLKWLFTVLSSIRIWVTTYWFSSKLQTEVQCEHVTVSPQMSTRGYCFCYRHIVSGGVRDKVVAFIAFRREYQQIFIYWFGRCLATSNKSFTTVLCNARHWGFCFSWIIKNPGIGSVIMP